MNSTLNKCQEEAIQKSKYIKADKLKCSNCLAFNKTQFKVKTVLVLFICLIHKIC